ncbi:MULTISPECIES: hypothetical protein [Pandoraea]|uniref:DUF1064 domain-containing protein n=2 Tax=Pandoraea TaxID=93217 RepID=A0A5E4XJD4_9BURK|nr:MULTISPECIES: hypothetical protein [Pandoraea]VVE18578.1 hypothetical protein PCE31107_03028 [Pandoraea cepalis]VVE36427.1 hypothetical protein PTE31013_03949 [Pandoraea terrigena]
MATGLRFSEEEYKALKQRTGSRAAPPAVEALTTEPAAPKPQDRMLALGRLPQGKMNRTEAAYAAHLEMLKHAGEITWYQFEAIKLRLGKNTFYTPDFAVRLKSGELELHEVKGFWKDDARVKIKSAAYLYPIFRFVALTMIRKRDGGGWRREEF